jgi:Nuclear transport factor 2 (NTF2) domain
MAASSSGASTPARDKSVTPTPTTQSNEQSAVGSVAGMTSTPLPRTVATRFVFTYYKTLSVTPDQIHRLYRPSSVLSVGSGTVPTCPSTFDTLSLTNPRDRLFSTSADDNEDTTIDTNCLIRFEIDKDTIDAQQSVDNAILLVVTGHIVYLKPDEPDTTVARKAFVHTFFLRTITAPAGGKVSYYVHNDILRFLQPSTVESLTTTTTETTSSTETATTTIVSDSTTATNDPAVAAASTMSTNDVGISEAVVEPTTSTTDITETATTPEAIADSVKEESAEKDVVVDDAPGGGVEESKEVMTDDDDDEDEDEIIATNNAAIIEAVPASDIPISQNGATADSDKVDKLEEVVDIVSKSNVSGTKKGTGKTPDIKPVVPPTNNDSKSKATTADTAKQSSAKPSSWASLVSSGGSAPPAPASVATPTQPKPTASTTGPPPALKSTTSTNTSNSQPHSDSTTTTTPIEENPKTILAEKTESVPVQKETNHRTNQQQQAPAVRLVGNDTYRRDPDSTLVIRNIPYEATEKDIMGIFEKFATDINGRVIRCTVNADRAIAFMDYDSPDPVMTAIAIHKDEPFFLMDRKLHIYQKIQANQPNQGGGGGSGGGKGNSGGGSRGAGGGKNGSGRISESGNEGEQGNAGRPTRSGGASSGRGADGGGRSNYRRGAGGDGGRGRGGRSGR